jgi:hypothetical protein
MSADRDVFINCPFDLDYQPFFRAIVFVVIRSGFRARCALETDDTSENRFEKICKIISDCRYAIGKVLNLLGIWRVHPTKPGKGAPHGDETTCFAAHP